MTDLLENTPLRKTGDDGRRGSDVSMDSSTSNRKRPSLRGSAKFRRIPSAADSQSSMEDKMLALNALLSDSLLITEFPAGNEAVSRNGKANTTDDDTLKEEFGDNLSDDDFEELPEDGRSSRDVDYDTDLDMDYDGITLLCIVLRNLRITSNNQTKSIYQYNKHALQILHCKFPTALRFS